MPYIFFALNLFKNNKYCFFPVKSQIAQLFYLKFHSSILKGYAYLGNNFYKFVKLFIKKHKQTNNVFNSYIFFFFYKKEESCTGLITDKREI